MTISSRLRGGLSLALATTLSLGAFAGATAANAADEPAMPVETRAAAPFVAELTTEIMIGDGVGPGAMEFSHDGRYAYVVGVANGTLNVVDLEAKELVRTISLGSEYADGVVLNAAQTLAYVQVGTSYFAPNVAVVDLASGTVIATHTFKHTYINDLVLTPDESSYYITGSDDVMKVNAVTGEIEAKQTVGINMHAMVLSADNSKLFVKNNVYTQALNVLDPADLSIISILPTPGEDVHDLVLTSNPDVLYGVSFNAAISMSTITGEILTKQGVGTLISDIVLSPDETRAYTAVGRWGMAMSANFTTGVRSESYRTIPTGGGSEIGLNPVTGDLLSADTGYIGERGSSVTLINAAAVTDPEDQVATTIGQDVTFSTIVEGIKPHYGGGLRWQASTDGGTTWAELEGQNRSELTVEVTPETVAALYRVSFSDDFWGTSGVSEAAQIVVDGPKITREGDLPAGTVGTEYAPIVIDAAGQSDIAWSVDSVSRAAGGPAGLALDPATGTLSGTPAAAGDYVLTVTVTDSFGTDTKDFNLSIAEAATVPGPGEEKPGTEQPGTETPGTETPGIDGSAKPLPGDQTDGGSAPHTADGSGLAVTGNNAATALFGSVLLLLAGGLLLSGRVARRQ
ncbi:putative Ig domain-containing protein [Lysinibacter cavernae]|uniref:Uncharacterized protein n=1 Tax=Lysinibacter cavernae TaxID=1640652 RepID=A0A7X5R4A0_9MICO|nr:putative Ig domain-containing protein [Lysinibacter cavernae]NIH55351.1 hypothetical protein [Lysinibacter cavernae]